MESKTDASKSTTVSIEILKKVIMLRKTIFQELQLYNSDATFRARKTQHARGTAYSKLKPAAVNFCFAQRLAGISFFCVAY